MLEYLRKLTTPSSLYAKKRIARGQLRLAFVVPWYGKNIGGGAESACRNLVLHIKKFKPGVDVAVLTTALKEFSADWNDNVHTQGCSLEDDINIYRFYAEPIDRAKFYQMNKYRLMPSVVQDLMIDHYTRSPLTAEEEQFFIKQMIYSPALIKFIKTKYHFYDYFIFIPYMFGTTYYGSSAAQGKAVIIPCLHNERYAYMELYKNMMTKAKAAVFFVPAEQRLANKLYKLNDNDQIVLGAMVDIHNPQGDPGRFQSKYQIKSPFILYAGRIVEGKNVLELIEYFLFFKKTSHHPVKLVFIGGGDINLSKYQDSDICHLGFIPTNDKFDAMAAAELLCQPSVNESFSIVMMESWLQKTAVFVSAHCEVTKEHCEISGGGLSYEDREDFCKKLELLLNNKDLRSKMAELGENYVLNHFAPEVIVERFVEFLQQKKLKG